MQPLELCLHTFHFPLCPMFLHLLTLLVDVTRASASTGSIYYYSANTTGALAVCTSCVLSTMVMAVAGKNRCLHRSTEGAVRRGRSLWVWGVGAELACGHLWASGLVLCRH